MALALEDRIAVACRALGRSVVALNPRAREQAAEKNVGFATVGVKDTADLPRELIDLVATSPDHLLLTIDRMSDLGRSVDTELVNPLTYRPMTGSTSGGAINVLKGINDVCVGTDGGGSVLAPAVAASLYSLMGKGLGLVVGEGVSTDGIGFAGGVGFIGNALERVIRLAELAAGTSLSGGSPGLVVVPERGCAALPDGSDMRELLEPFVALLGAGWHVAERRFADPYDRAATVRDLRALWEELPDACVLSLEGPVDLLAPDETIPRGFGPRTSGVVAGVRSKALCKAVNIAGGTGITLPTSELATGLLVSCGAGVRPARAACALARELGEAIELPAPLTRYFLDRTKAPHPLRLFSERADTKMSAAPLGVARRTEEKRRT